MVPQSLQGRTRYDLTEKEEDLELKKRDTHAMSFDVWLVAVRWSKALEECRESGCTELWLSVPFLVARKAVGVELSVSSSKDWVWPEKEGRLSSDSQLTSLCKG